VVCDLAKPVARTAPMGVKTIGSLCFTAVSARSAFVPLTIITISWPPIRMLLCHPLMLWKPGDDHSMNHCWKPGWTLPGKGWPRFNGIAGNTLRNRHPPPWTRLLRGHQAGPYCSPRACLQLPSAGAFSDAPSLYLRANDNEVN